ncbi:hypothetical protein LCGC14_2612610 [marine sediment metagenome]|uniref:Uncharacterized protein n=1 Tax=marine sediment metagenome TaxID=412755 RepID=A0A0F9AT42_9ZZZZ
MKTEINTLLALASQLPTGLHDPRALDKLECELEELKGAAIAGDHLGAAMEAGDVGYYAIKAESNGLMNEAQRDKFIRYAADFVDLEPEMLLDCAIAKYELRAIPGNPKDDAASRKAVALVLTA